MHILVVEDETMVARHLCRLIRGILQERIQTLHHADCLESAQDYLANHSIDLLFLDLNLSGDDGFDLLSEMVASPFQTIIVSANSDQALRSYEYGVIDFIPKPFNSQRLERALQKLAAPDRDLESGSGKAKYLGVRYLGKTLLLPVTDVVHIKAAGRYSEIVMADGAIRLHEKKLKQVLLVLPLQFQRIHKSHVVNLNLASSIVTQPGSKYELHLTDGTVLPIGRTYLEHLRKRLA